MGNTTSTPTPTSQQVFASDSPVSFSEGLVNSLQKSPESDSTRAKELEHQIQARVTEELQKLLSSSNSRFSSASDAVSNEPFTPPPPPADPSQGPGFAEKPIFNRLYERLTGTGDASNTKQVTRPDLDSPAVQKEIDKLKAKLGAAKQVRDMDEGVKTSKDDLVKCLRMNDRRPLDCWQEVEKFKSEVGRLEKSFMDSNGR